MYFMALTPLNDTAKDLIKSLQIFFTDIFCFMYFMTLTPLNDTAKDPIKSLHNDTAKRPYHIIANLFLHIYSVSCTSWL